MLTATRILAIAATKLTISFYSEWLDATVDATYHYDADDVGQPLEVWADAYATDRMLTAGDHEVLYGELLAAIKAA